MTSIEWRDDHVLLNGCRFNLPRGLRVVKSAEHLFLFKPPHMVEPYLRIEPRDADRVVELGVFGGGSTAFLAEVWQPTTMVALDRSTKPLPLLDRFLADRGLAERVHVHLGVDQGDRPTIEAILGRYFGDHPLDVVVDDASHRDVPTRVSFDALFPRLRPGGRFVIEDWSWALLLLASTAMLPVWAERVVAPDVESRLRRHDARMQWADAVLDDLRANPSRLRELLTEYAEGFRLAALGDESVRERLMAIDPEVTAALLDDDLERVDVAAPPRRRPFDSEDLTSLTLQLVLLTALAPTVVEAVEINYGQVWVTRGSATLDPTEFRLDDLVPAEVLADLGRR